ncbi:hypothetical protein BBK36DRAFT_1109004 [Trichoderma citrinoviride]|uniref:Cora-domain-containing protein n=1 Tax=Trichoderma citrinoviride TaxID=58853 RepID=A0A2T4BNG7_9HYPO|nr:hypothetical protein BBK36DRAFT_1109004 [Trichoderma citrinoviride]PTB70857.1 hypothetical protein BBK36DRAFT_1109004 [Trichoderma citrinoviride]
MWLTDERDRYAEGDKVRQCRRCRAAFSTKFLVPRSWWTTLARRSNGYFGYQDVLDENGLRTGTTSWTRFMVKRISKVLDKHGHDELQYHWVKLNAFTRWHSSSRQNHQQRPRTEIVLFDHPQFARLVGASLLRDVNPRELGDPFWVFPSMVDEMVQLHDVTIWESRNLIRDFEKRRSFYKYQYGYLREIPRHLTHVNETVYVTESVLASIEKSHAHFLNTKQAAAAASSSSSSPNLVHLNIQRRLDAFHSMLTNLRHRAESNSARITTEMALTYNDAARVDSSAMRAISLVGLVFLPAAFVAAIFSTSFFNFDAPTGVWRLSGQFWIYWAVAVPLTVLTVVSWFWGTRCLDRVWPGWRRWLE